MIQNDFTIVPPMADSVLLSFSAGSVNGDDSCQPVTIFDDDIFEGTEDFQVFLSSPTGGANLASPSMATVTLTDNDRKLKVHRYINRILCNLRIITLYQKCNSFIILCPPAIHVIKSTKYTFRYTFIIITKCE